MLTVPASRVADRALRLIGMEPTECTLMPSMRERFEDAVNDAIGAIWADQKWLPLMRIEFRRYRPLWHPEELYIEGQEVWHEGAYWRILATRVNPSPEPVEGSTVWRKLLSEEVVKMIEFAQPWEETVIDDAGVDCGAFAWQVNPRLNPHAPPIDGVTFWMDSVLLPSGAPDGVWCRFLPLRPRVSFVEFKEGKAYAKGEVCYRTLTGHCYEALHHGITTPPAEDPDYNLGLWREVLIPEFLVPYIAFKVAAAYMSEEQGKYQTQAMAERELEAIRLRYFEKSSTAQGMRINIRRGRRG